MLVRSGSLHGLSSTAPASTGTTEVNQFNRPFPWYCGAIGWTGLSDECRPKSVEQINTEADEWLRRKVQEGKLSPTIAEQGIARSRDQVKALCAEEPGACEMLDAYANSPKCAALLPAQVCNALGSDTAFFGVGVGLGLLVLVLVLKR